MANKYVVYVDFLCNKYDYFGLTAKTPYEAVAEAERIYNHIRKREGVYLIRIMEKSGKVERLSDWKRQKYVARLCKRSVERGWHENDDIHGENPHEVYKYTNCISFYSMSEYEGAWSI